MIGGFNPFLQPPPNPNLSLEERVARLEEAQRKAEINQLKMLVIIETVVLLVVIFWKVL